jgi:hypothetical protein
MMGRFRNNVARVLIATDSVAKGIDVPNVTMVVHVSNCMRVCVRARVYDVILLFMYMRCHRYCGYAFEQTRVWCFAL